MLANPSVSPTMCAPRTHVCMNDLVEAYAAATSHQPPARLLLCYSLCVWKRNDPVRIRSRSGRAYQ